jgi:hypothetical protein
LVAHLNFFHLQSYYTVQVEVIRRYDSKKLSCSGDTVTVHINPENNPTFNHLIIFCSENRHGSTFPFCLFDRVLNVISIKDIHKWALVSNRTYY